VRVPITRPAPGSGPIGQNNVFPYASCTWWADQRYYQLHGVFVPWRINANAWQWTARAYEFGWRVSALPTVGAIMDLQPNVEGAWGMGHVAVVERVLPNGHVIASSMSWYPYWWLVTDYEFVPGPGVTFISQ
jgi:surface antigen